jgi:hypothetical protein
VEQRERLQPPGRYCVGALENVNAEAGPSTLIDSRVPSVGPPIMQPFGGISETAADTENQTRTEKDKSPVSHFYRSRIPRVSD